MEILISASFSTYVNSVLVNWRPWPVLTIFDAPYFASMAILKWVQDTGVG